MTDPTTNSPPSLYDRVYSTVPWAAAAYAAHKARPLAQYLDGLAGRAIAPLASYGGRAAGTLAGLAGGPATLSALTAAAVMRPVEANAGEVPYYTINPLTGKYEPNPAMRGATPPGGTPASAAAQQPASPLPFAGPNDAAMPSGSPGAAAAGSPIMQAALSFMSGQGGPGLGTLAGGPAPAIPQAPTQPQAAPQPAAGFFGGSPSTNPLLQDQNPGYSGPGSTGFQDGSQLAGAPYTPPGAALIQKFISALGGVTNGGPLSIIGNLNPGKFGGY
jgi:hypothetical protein